ncbi:MAG: hypothetical protein HY718_14715 [Planctomycetes bacterium]|nr:hypothetical protein [Planctomycetota bacterium]
MIKQRDGGARRIGRWSFAVLCLVAAAGCSQTWEYHALRDVQTELPNLTDRQWSRRREYSDAEKLAVRAGGTQVLLIARSSRPAIEGDVAQLDEQVSHTFIIVLDGPVKAGRTYHVTPDNGRLIEGTTFRPAWRPYRGLEGDVTITAVSQRSIDAAVRLTGLTLKASDPARSLSGVHSFKIIGGGDPFLDQAQIRFEGGGSEK